MKAVIVNNMTIPDITKDLREMGVSTEGCVIAKMLFITLYPYIQALEENGNTEENIANFFTKFGRAVAYRDTPIVEAVNE